MAGLDNRKPISEWLDFDTRKSILITWQDNTLYRDTVNGPITFGVKESMFMLMMYF